MAGLGDFLKSNLGASLAGGLVGGLGNVATSLINNHYQQQANEQNIRAQKDINNQNIENQWKMWNATNEYNSPVAQMARYREAGLNPNLIYGQGSSGNATQANIGTAQAPQVQAKQMQNAQIFSQASQYMSLLLQQEEVQSKQIDNEIQSSIANDIKFQNGWQTQILEQTLAKLKVDIASGEKDNAIKDINKAIRQWELLQQPYKLNMLQFDNKLKANDVSNIRKYNDLLDYELTSKRYQSEIDRLDYENKEFYKKYQRSIENGILQEQYYELLRQNRRNKELYPIYKNMQEIQYKSAVNDDKWYYRLGVPAVNTALNLGMMLLGMKYIPKPVKGFKSY